MRCKAHNKVLIAVIKRTTDRFIGQAISKDKIIVPETRDPVTYGTLFLIDDVTPLGIELPKELVDKLSENNLPTIVFNAQELANSLANIMPYDKKIAILSGGGVLSYLFLRRAGYREEIGEIIDMRREYSSGKPVCELHSRINTTPELLIDDVLASGQTISKVIRKCRSDLEIACLLASSNIPKGNKSFRQRQGSTIDGAKKLYCAQFVNGLRQPVGYNSKPAILSLRYLITKAVEEEDYSKFYLARKFGGERNAQEIRNLLKNIETEPLNLLRTRPLKFLEQMERT